MIDINELRQNITTYGLEATCADDLIGLLDRLEAAESARRDDYQNWMTALDRNAELLAKLEAAEKEREIDEQRIADLMADLNRIGHENDTLRAKIAEMERQEPVGKFIRHPSNGLWEQDGYGDNPDARSLYALPGAQGEEK